MSVQTAKDLVAKLAFDEEFRSTVEQAGEQDEQRRVIDEAGFGDVSPDDLLAVQSAVEQKGMLGDLGKFLGESIVRAGFDPLNVGGQNAGNIGSAVGNAVDLGLKIFLV